MKEDKEITVIYTTDPTEVFGEQFRDLCVHIVCTEGTASFQYNHHEFTFGKGDVVVISYPEEVSAFTCSEDLQVEVLVAERDYIRKQMPSNNYSIGGSISLYQDPVMHADEYQLQNIISDIHMLRDRSKYNGHRFQRSLMTHLILVLVYDLFDLHASLNEYSEVTDRHGDIVNRLISMLSSAEVLEHRDVSYYAGKLNVSSKYLSDTVKRTTGKTALELISEYTIPMIIEKLNNPKLSLSQISNDLNFSSLSYFSRYCSKHLGLTPSDYRESSFPQTKKRKDKVL